ncbi:MAG: zinc metalloprotease HtpX [Chloroflexi bacterium]|nr:zinc metalloprotease HtpX [Chloroflexota bacterium]
MRRRWQGGDTELSARMFLVMFLLAALYLGFITVLASAGVDLPSVILIAAVLLGIQYFFSDKIALWSMGGRVVSPQEAPELHALVERLAAMADMPKPQVALVPHAMPNAFATGRGPGSSVVAVTTGLLDRLDPPELEAVLAHELSHVRNRDVLVMTLASFFAMVAQLLLRSMWWGGMGGGRRRDNAGLIYLASLLVWAISFLLIRALSRYREYAADRGGGLLTGAPSQLASALSKISGSVQRIPSRDLREVEAMNALFIIPALGRGSLMELFATHPPLEERIERLMRLAAEMERPG